MSRSPDSLLETISAGRLSQKIGETCSGQQYWVTGECKNAWKNSGSIWRFDLVAQERQGGKAGKLSIIPCHIWPEDVQNIDGYLKRQGSSLDDALVDGMRLTVHGETDMWANSLRLKISRIRPGFRRTGSLHRERQEALAEFAKSHPHHTRISRPRDRVHSRSDEGIPIPADSLKRVTVIGPERSQGRNDFKFELGKAFNSSQDIDYQSINWSKEGAADRFGKLVHAAKTSGQGVIVVVRGGGHWLGMQVFESRILAEIIINAEVPVVTAVGHYDDVSLADRAAMASFVTPSAAAAAISRSFRAHKSQAFRDRDQQVAKRVQEQRQQGEERMAGLHAELCAAKSELLSLRRDGAKREKQHVQELLEMARRRVRGYSRMAAALVVGATVAVCFGTAGFLDFFGLVPTFHAVLATQCTAVVAAWLVTWRLDEARAKINLPAAKPMRIPPSKSGWMSKIKKVRTVHRLRQLQRHLPVGAEEAEV